MYQKNRNTILLLLSMALIILSVNLIYDLPSSVISSLDNSQTSVLSPEHRSSGQVEAALKVVINPVPAGFSSDLESPFRPYKLELVATASQRIVQTKSEVVRTPLRLKGLMGSKPLAILEDNRGETFIKGQGDVVHDATIISISHASVVLRDSQGTYELRVEENR